MDSMYRLFQQRISCALPDTDKQIGRQQQQDYSIADSYTLLLSACVRVFELLLAVCLAFAEKAIRPVALPGSTPTNQRSPIYYSIHQLLSSNHHHPRVNLPFKITIVPVARFFPPFRNHRLPPGARRRVPPILSFPGQCPILP